MNSSNTSSISECDDDASQGAYAQLTTIISDQTPMQKEEVNTQDRGSYPTPPSELDECSNSPTMQFLHMNPLNSFTGSQDDYNAYYGFRMLQMPMHMQPLQQFRQQPGCMPGIPATQFHQFHQFMPQMTNDINNMYPMYENNIKPDVSESASVCNDTTNDNEEDTPALTATLTSQRVIKPESQKAMYLLQPPDLASVAAASATASANRSKRRTRIKFSQHQLNVLEATFEKTHYPDVSIVDRLSDVLSLATERICIWFQNRRARFKKQKKNDPGSANSEDANDSVSSVLPSSNSSQSLSSYDQINFNGGACLPLKRLHSINELKSCYDDDQESSKDTTEQDHGEPVQQIRQHFIENMLQDKHQLISPTHQQLQQPSPVQKSDTSSSEEHNESSDKDTSKCSSSIPKSSSSLSISSKQDSNEVSPNYYNQTYYSQNLLGFPMPPNNVSPHFQQYQLPQIHGVNYYNQNAPITQQYAYQMPGRPLTNIYSQPFPQLFQPFNADCENSQPLPNMNMYYQVAKQECEIENESTAQQQQPQMEFLQQPLTNVSNNYLPYYRAKIE